MLNTEERQIEHNQLIEKGQTTDQKLPQCQFKKWWLFLGVFLRHPLLDNSSSKALQKCLSHFSAPQRHLTVSSDQGH